MLGSRLLPVFSLTATCLGAALSPPAAPDVVLQTRNLPGERDEDTLRRLHKRLSDLTLQGRDIYKKASGDIHKSWQDAVLFQKSFAPPDLPEEVKAEAGIEIKCVDCYFKGGATVEFSVKGEFDATATIKNLTDQVGREFDNLTDSMISSLRSVIKSLPGKGKEIAGNVFNDGFDTSDFGVFDFDEFDIDADFDIDMPPLPGVQLGFKLDDLELYMLLNAKFNAAATLELPLYRSPPSIYNIPITPDTHVGVSFSADLIISVEGSIDLRGGFHLKLAPPLGFQITMFSKNVSEILFNGGKFEFLPVEIHSANTVMKALLRVGMHAGFELKTPKVATFKVSAGVGVGVFAHVAELKLNMTGGTQIAADTGCALKIEEEYTFALGAGAGATVAVQNNTWGFEPKTTVPIFYTKFLDVCAVTAAAGSPKPTAAIATKTKRQNDPNLRTTTLTRVLTETAITCAIVGVIPCPVSLQSTFMEKKTETHVTAVPRGSPAAFPVSIQDAPVTSTRDFGPAVKALSATSGAPTSFVPPPPSDTRAIEDKFTSKAGDIINDAGDKLNEAGDKLNEAKDKAVSFINGNTNGVSNKLILGLALGIGIPLLIIFIALLVRCLRQRREARYAPIGRKNVRAVGGGSDPYISPMSGPPATAPGPTVPLLGANPGASGVSEVTIKYKDNPTGPEQV
ncbi:hypothetical protein QBC35DRAFT_59346 [Podospora australis]|uniref:Mid2 domain-containing protein n=1 Tax=Podospora australis TaxID=1536484 RepID=A0AAN6WQ41_9PEZI|nr:hypothetical protein QBC35DRAFT_59346 [Podospora australis]